MGSLEQVSQPFTNLRKYTMSQVAPLFSDGKASVQLNKLLKLTNVNNHNGEILTVLAVVQAAWHRPTQQTGDIEDVFAHLKAETKPIFTELGFIGEQTHTSEPIYDYATIGGAYILGVRKRFALLKRLWDTKRIDFLNLVLCGGKRPANPAKESLEIINTASGGLTLLEGWQPLIEVPATEDLIMETVLLQSNLPKAWQNKSFYTAVDTPLQADRPSKPDPSAEATLYWWLKTKSPASGSSVLLVYSQPQLRHIEIVARRIFEPRDIRVDCIGYEAPGEINVSQVLDTIAKVVYELAKSYWCVKVKDENGMTSGRVIVAEISEPIAREEIRKISSEWDDGSYIPRFAKLHGPFPTYGEAKEVII